MKFVICNNGYGVCICWEDAKELAKLRGWKVVESTNFTISSEEGNRTSIYDGSIILSNGKIVAFYDGEPDFDEKGERMTHSYADISELDVKRNDEWLVSLFLTNEDHDYSIIEVPDSFCCEIIRCYHYSDWSNDSIYEKPYFLPKDSYVKYLSETGKTEDLLRYLEEIKKANDELSIRELRDRVVI